MNHERLLPVNRRVLSWCGGDHSDGRLNSLFREYKMASKGAVTAFFSADLWYRKSYASQALHACGRH
jgi:hypothetical protein